MAEASPPAADVPLGRYRQKRDFDRTPEPDGLVDEQRPATRPTALKFVIQKHWARSLHYDLRLELDGVFLSWAVPKGPSFDPSHKRMAIHVEDHPLAYGDFEGEIPRRQYGAGNVIVWDRGTWEAIGDPSESLKVGKLVFQLRGEKLAGLWELVRTARSDADKNRWLLFKKRDEWAKPLSEYDVTSALPDSVLTRPLGPIEALKPLAPLARLEPHEPSEALPQDAASQVGTLAALPRRLEPQLATLVETPPPGANWLIEAKFDGYRLMVRHHKGKARLVTRGGHDWTGKLPTLAAALERLPIGESWLDGEIVVLDDQGLPDFGALQNALDGTIRSDIVYFVFDAPFLEGRDLRRVALHSRRDRLRALLMTHPGTTVRFSEAFDAPPEQVLEAARRTGLEGIVLKRRDAPYTSGRSEDWLKLKRSLRQEFVVCGFRDRAGSEIEVGALILGYHENGHLRSAGSVGTGWDADTARSLRTRLAELETDVATLDPDSLVPRRGSQRKPSRVHWVSPELVAEIVFAGWTSDGHLRHASFKGLRLDKPASEIVRESPREVANYRAKRLSAETSDVSDAAARIIQVSHPDRVVDSLSGLTKLNLVRYYQSIADWIMPHLDKRPVSLLRAPDGISGEQFFQKHATTRMPGVVTLDAGLWPGHAPLLAIPDARVLVQAAQMNMIEIHTWNATTPRLDRPDRMVFDLDPGEGVTWNLVQDAARLTHALLAELGLECWLKTSGGKGLHLLVPLARAYDSTVVKGFSRAVVQHLARTIPGRFAARSGPSNRIGKIFVDYLRNGQSQTTVAAFSARARPGMGVSMPIDWEQLTSVKSGDHWTVASARDHLSVRKTDPWALYWTSRQRLTSAMRKLGYEAPKAAGRKTQVGPPKRTAKASSTTSRKRSRNSSNGSGK